MQMTSARLPRTRRTSGRGPEPSRDARKRLNWFDHHRSHGRNAAFTCRHFGIGRATLFPFESEAKARPQARAYGDRPARSANPGAGAGRSYGSDNRGPGNAPARVGVRGRFKD